ncbi:MAG: 23S rRNA (uracil(1939)-C(5))-methyltransferase RlmD [Bdellovibrionales bacterium]|nr:23S rRNA (uracil(1939)-C(5))-methyltransferase RlmD [Bdellovibrionales bacterium]
MSSKISKPENVPCVHWNECSGCPLIRFDYKDQLRHKRDKVLAAFVQAGFEKEKLTSILKPTKASPKTLGYRNKAKWILQPDSKGRLKMGIYESGTHNVIDIPHCAVHAPVINEVSAFIKEELTKHGVYCSPDIDLKRPKAQLRYVIVRYSFREKKWLAVFVTSAGKIAHLDEVLAAITAKYGDRVSALVQNINADSGNVLLGEANRYVRKQGELTETLGRFRVPIGPLSFLQVNPFQASYLYKRVRELIGNGPFEAGLDLYSGVGLFALHLASTTKRILAVEEVGPAALEAMTAARRNRAKNVLQLCSDALEGVQTFHGEWGSPDWVVLNPPRKGCDEAVLKLVASKPPRKIAYISCNPVSLARDIALLQSEHPEFVLKTVEPVDMFPQTEHVECIALLENKSYSRSTSTASGKSPSPKKKLH